MFIDVHINVLHNDGSTTDDINYSERLDPHNLGLMVMSTMERAKRLYPDMCGLDLTITEHNEH